MKQTRKSSRRIVSKGYYALEQGRRAGQAVASLVVLSSAAFTGLLTLVCFVIMIPPHLRNLFKTHDVLWHLIAISAYLAMAVYLGFLTVSALRVGVTGIKEAAKSDVVPFTRANAGDLPANDSLVRASSEPIQTRENVLLRAAATAQEQHEEQLLRPAQ